MRNKVIYLDNSATTPLYSKVLKDMNDIFLRDYGNPSSAHEIGDEARKKLNEARGKLAREIGAKESEIIFTSGASEANNLALYGVLDYSRVLDRKKIIISAIEHASIYEPAMELKKKGYNVVEIPVNNEGLLNLDVLEKEIKSDCLIASIIHGHNEIGVLQDLRKIGEICRREKVLFHTDAVQSYGKERINVKEMGIGLLSASAHKIGGPKGIGFLYAREGIKIKPLIAGGGQEAGRRGGTENVPGAVGFASALEIIKKADKEKIKNLRDYFMNELEKIGGKINGQRGKRLWNNVHATFPVDAEMLAIKLSQKGIMCSTKSACSEKKKKENRILSAMGLKDKEINGSLRFVLNEFTTKRDLEHVAREIRDFVEK